MASSGRPDSGTVDEIVSLLKKSSLPTIIIEGKDDVIVYRSIEKKLSRFGVSVFPVGGRKKLLEIFLRRSEIHAHSQVLFIADKDSWVYTGIPAEYSSDHLLFTNGYSIENDIYVDGELWGLLSKEENEKFDADLKAFIEWFALAIERYLSDSTIEISLPPEHVLHPTNRPKLLALNKDEEYPHERQHRILCEYKTLLRGKSLLNLLMLHVSYKGRQPRHTSTGIMELVAMRHGPLLNKMAERIESIISPDILEFTTAT